MIPEAVVRREKPKGYKALDGLPPDEREKFFPFWDTETGKFLGLYCRNCSHLRGNCIPDCAVSLLEGRPCLRPSYMECLNREYPW